MSIIIKASPRSRPVLTGLYYGHELCPYTSNATRMGFREGKPAPGHSFHLIIPHLDISFTSRTDKWKTVKCSTHSPPLPPAYGFDWRRYFRQQIIAESPSPKSLPLLMWGCRGWESTKTRLRRTLRIKLHTSDRLFLNQLPPSDAVRKQKKKYFRGSFQFGIVTI